MLNKIQNTVNSPEFKKMAIQVTGGIVSIAANVIIMGIVSHVVELGVNAVIEKFVTETPAE